MKRKTGLFLFMPLPWDRCPITRAKSPARITTDAAAYGRSWLPLRFLVARLNAVLFSARIMARLLRPFLRFATSKLADIRAILIATLVANALGGCSAVPLFTKHLPGDRAFIKQWPADANSNRL